MLEKETKNIIFDFDGVLVDSFHFAYKVKLRLNPDLKESQYRSLFTGNIYKNLKKIKLIEEEDFFYHYKKSFHNLEMQKDFKNKIMKLSKKYRLDIISSSESYLIKEFLEYNKIDMCFDSILGSDISKSKVVKFNSLFEKDTFTLHNTYFVTDTTGDIKEAKEFGLKNIIAVWKWTWQDKKTLKEKNPKMFLKSILEI